MKRNEIQVVNFGNIDFFNFIYKYYNLIEYSRQNFWFGLYFNVVTYVFFLY